jgi:hypothetical protein
MWCFGNTCIVRHGDTVYASGVERVAGSIPLNNIRWALWRRDAGGWRQLLRDEIERTREPSPLGIFPDGRLLLSVNPTLTGPGDRSGPAEPRILELVDGDPGPKTNTLLPEWEGKPEFTEHSYRSFALDGANRELFLMQNVGYSHAAWTYLDGEGKWSANGCLYFPWEDGYDTPQHVRICYPTVALRDGSVFLCGVSDIHEPNEKWAEYKRKITGGNWDYDFRRLFYTSCTDVRNGKFEGWIEISSRDATAGWITPCDLWVGPRGRIHVLWLERAIDERLRERFFPGKKQEISLNHGIIYGTRLERREIIAQKREGSSESIPGTGRFHPHPDGRLFVIYSLGREDDIGRENCLVEILEDGSPGPVISVPLRTPLSRFFTATQRAGCPPSTFIDMLGEHEGTMRYARFDLEGQL